MYVRLRRVVLLFPFCSVLAGCPARPVENPPPDNDTTISAVVPQTVEKDIDILFVIDNSGSMAQEQANLRANFGEFIDNLVMEELGNKLPNVHIGVVTSDIGIGQYSQAHPCDICGGQQGLLRLPNSPYDDNNPQFGAPVKGACDVDLVANRQGDWIEYTVEEDSGDETTNVDPLASGETDSIELVKAAFSCMADVGTQGCGLEQHLEAAHWALDPEGVPSYVQCSTANPTIPDGTRTPQNAGFLRDDAFLAVVFLADEDDCSGFSDYMYNNVTEGLTLNEQLTHELGPFQSFRCFDLLADCEGNTQETSLASRREFPKTWTGCDVSTTKARSNGDPYGKAIADFVGTNGFFRNIKSSPGRVILFAIAGPVPENGEVSVVEFETSGKPDIAPSCESSGQGKAAPALRIKAALEGFGAQGHFNEGVDDEGNSTDVNICSSDYGTALKRLADIIVATLGGQCLTKPLITSENGVACSPGVFVGTDAEGNRRECGESDNCLFNVDCAVSDVQGQSTGDPIEEPIAKCEESLFEDLSNEECNPCPCWRVYVPRDSSTGEQRCNPDEDGSPYAIEVLRSEDPPNGTVAKIFCRTATSADTFFDLPNCGSGQ